MSACASSKSLTNSLSAGKFPWKAAAGFGVTIPGTSGNSSEELGFLKATGVLVPAHTSLGGAGEFFRDATSLFSRESTAARASAKAKPRLLPRGTHCCPARLHPLTDDLTHGPLPTQGVGKLPLSPKLLRPYAKPAVKTNNSTSRMLEALHEKCSTREWHS